MNRYELAKDSFKKLNKQEKRFLILELLLNNDIDFTVISEDYVSVLEERQKRHRAKECLFAGCLATKYQQSVDNTMDIEYSDARASLLIEPFVPENFCKTYFKKFSKKVLDKEKALIKRELK